MGWSLFQGGGDKWASGGQGDSSVVHYCTNRMASEGISVSLLQRVAGRGAVFPRFISDRPGGYGESGTIVRGPGSGNPRAVRSIHERDLGGRGFLHPTPRVQVGGATRGTIILEMVVAGCKGERPWVEKMWTGRGRDIGTDAADDGSDCGESERGSTWAWHTSRASGSEADGSREQMSGGYIIAIVGVTVGIGLLMVLVAGPIQTRFLGAGVFGLGVVAGLATWVGPFELMWIVGAVALVSGVLVALNRAGRQLGSPALLVLGLGLMAVWFGVTQGFLS